MLFLKQNITRMKPVNKFLKSELDLNKREAKKYKIGPVKNSAINNKVVESQ